MINIHQTAVIYEGVTIEENVEIGAFCIIGAPPEHLSHYDKPNKGVVIKSGTKITGHVTIDAGIFEPTTIGSNCFIMKGSHIGHDAVIGDNVTLSCHSIIGGHSVVCNHANIGLGAILHQYTVVGGGSMIGMGSIVTKKSIIEPFTKHVGNPARFIGYNNYKLDNLLNWDKTIINEQYKDAENSGMFYNTKQGKTK